MMSIFFPDALYGDGVEKISVVYFLRSRNPHTLYFLVMDTMQFVWISGITQRLVIHLGKNCMLVLRMKACAPCHGPCSRCFVRSKVGE